METNIIEVANSMSPQGIFIGNVSEVAIETSTSTEESNSSFPKCGSDYLLSSVHGRGVGLSRSPTSKFPLEDFSVEDIEIPSLELDEHDEDIVADYTSKMNLTEVVIKGISQTGKNALDVLSLYDAEKSGLLSIPIMKKCLTHHSLSLNESEFQMVFEGFIEDGNVNYIRFLKSWSDFIVDPEWTYSQKRSSCEQDGETGYSTPKRRHLSIASSCEDSMMLRESIGTLIVRHFGNYQGIFKELSINDMLYISDFYDYLIQHGISCSLNQLTLLLKPYCSSSALMNLDEFQRFVNDVTSRHTNVKLVEAFPNTFGYTTHISMRSGNRLIDFGKSKLHRTPSVAQNLNNLPLYRLMLNMNEESISSQEDDAVFV